MNYLFLSIKNKKQIISKSKLIDKIIKTILFSALFKILKRVIYSPTFYT